MEFVKYDSMSSGDKDNYFSGMNNGYKKGCVDVDGVMYPIQYSHKESSCLCELHFDIDGNFSNIVSFLEKSILDKRHTLLFWMSTELSNYYTPIMDKYEQHNFYKPHIVSMSPLKRKYNGSYRIAMVMKPRKKSPKSISSELKRMNSLFQLDNNIEFSLRRLKVIFAPDTIDYLHDQFKSNKLEHSGNLIIEKIIGTKNGPTFNITVDRETCINGGSENVEVVQSIMNFHTHPLTAYQTYSVKYAWPSNKDYIGIVKLDITIFHCVATQEGVYLICFNPYWSMHKKDMDISFIEKHYRDHDRYGYVENKCTLNHKCTKDTCSENTCGHCISGHKEPIANHYKFHKDKCIYTCNECFTHIKHDDCNHDHSKCKEYKPEDYLKYVNNIT
ncbi:hypothetical protein N9985_02855, partial [Gammaproteobacteria bacterium]|nr:hypothetical protein [Gammaproteobacteria bacterium]